MRLLRTTLFAILTSSGIAAVSFNRADTKQSHAAPTAIVANGTIVGSADESNNVDSFMGIPYAIQPTGTLRLTNPSPITTSFGTIIATGIPTACPGYLVSSGSPANLTSTVESVFGSNVTTGENCLNLNVQRSIGVTASSKVPVLVYIYGGGFEEGSTSQYDGTALITKAASYGLPLIYVAMSYRLGALGFLPGREMQGIANLGLKDQRLALKWIQDNIAAFGGDPDRVTIWASWALLFLILRLTYWQGESAGSISCFDHLIVNGGDISYKGGKLFQGAIMNSGSVLPALNISAPYNQRIYDHVVEASNCSSSHDTLTCLRSVSADAIIAAQASLPGIYNYQALHLTWFPRPDPSDRFYPTSPEAVVNTTAYAKVPIIIGDQEDEGTVFSLVQKNITTNDDLIAYIQQFFPESEPAVSETLVNSYPNDPAFGSPFRTGDKFSIYPQYKRLAAITGDLAFTLVRRSYLSDVTARGVTAWSYINTYLYGNSSLGTFHGADTLNDRSTALSKVAQNATQTYYIAFTYYQNPNAIMPSVQWPAWESTNRKLLNFTLDSIELGNDFFREQQYHTLVSLNGKLRE